MSAPPRCVLVDDDPEFMALVRLYLVRVSPRLEIVPFTCSLEAMGFLDRHHADLLITDFRMPLLDGLRLTRHVREADSHVPIVVMSGEEIGPQALAQGASAFVPKHDLLACIGEILDRFGLPRGEGS